MPVLKSPANIDKMPGGTELTARYAHKPDAGLSVANDGDPRLAVTSYVKHLTLIEREAVLPVLNMPI